MRILFISREYPPETAWGGISSYIVSIAPAFAARGHEVHVLSCVNGQEHKDYMDQGVYIHRRGQLNMPGINLFNRILRRAPFAVNCFKTGLSTFWEYHRLAIDFDVIEYPDWGAEGWLLARTSKKLLVCVLHTPLPIICRYHCIHMDYEKTIASFFEHFAVHHADIIISPSQILTKELEGIGWLKGRSVEAMPLPIDWRRWSAAQSMHETEPVVLFLGRLQKAKAPEILVEAISIIKKEIPEAGAVFIGGSNEREGVPYVEWIKKSFDTSGCQFIGQMPRQEIIHYISKSRVIAIPSRFDSYNLVALEAMAAGRPVVLSDKTGIAEFINEKGGCRVVPSDDPQALAEALLPFLSDASYAARTGETAREVVRTWLDPDVIAAERERVYLRALEVFASHREE